MLEVPNVDFSSTNFVWPMPPGGRNTTQHLVNSNEFETANMNMTEFCYAGPSIEVSKVAAAVGIQGRISQIDPPSSNSSWTTKFWGPAMSCENATSSEWDQIFFNYFQFLNQSMDTCTQAFSYLSWVPSDQSILPFVLIQTENSSWALREDRLTFGTGTSLFTAVIPAMWDNVNMPSHAITGACQRAADAWDSNTTWPKLLAESFPANSTQLFKCTFKNVSYVADFEYRNGAQSIDLTVVETGNDVEPRDCITGPSSATNGVGNYDQMWEEMTRANCSTLNTGDQRCQFDPAVLQTLSYQGVINAFVDLVRGTIGFDGFFTHIAYASDISTTSLMDSADLAFARDWESTLVQAPDLPGAMSSQAGEKYIGLANYNPPHSRGSLRSEMETMFQNITISLMSNSLLQ